MPPSHMPPGCLSRSQASVDETFQLPSEERDGKHSGGSKPADPKESAAAGEVVGAAGAVGEDDQLSSALGFIRSPYWVRNLLGVDVTVALENDAHQAASGGMTLTNGQTAALPMPLSNIRQIVTSPFSQNWEVNQRHPGKVDPAGQAQAGGQRRPDLLVTQTVVLWNRSFRQPQVRFHSLVNASGFLLGCWNASDCCRYASIGVLFDGQWLMADG